MTASAVVAASLVQTQARKAPPAKGLARVLAKMWRGQDVTVTAIGDSVLAGSTASIPGTNDVVSLVCTALASRYSVTVTKRNRAVGGSTVASWRTSSTYWTNAIADAADLYIISFGKNDIVADTGTAPTNRVGYPLEASLAHIEAMVRELRVRVPTSDILLMSENPYSSAYTSSNALLRKHGKGVERIARAYGCEWVDGYLALATSATGDSVPAYTTDGVHPNDAGYAAFYDAIMVRFPASWSPERAAQDGGVLFPAANPTTKKLWASPRQTRRSVRRITATAATAYAPKWMTSGSWSGSGPITSSSAAAYTYGVFLGSEVYLDVKLGAGQGVATIWIDGSPVDSSVDLSTMTDGKLLTYTGLGDGIHTWHVVVVSGSVTVNGFHFVDSRCEWFDVNADRVTVSGMGSAFNYAGFFGSAGLLTAAAGSVSFTFFGTGLSTEIHRASTGGTSYVTSLVVDGTTVAVSIPTTFSLFGAYRLVSGLKRGLHTVVLTFSGGGLAVGGFAVIDEGSDLAPDTLDGWAKSGEAVRFAVPFTTIPDMSFKGLSSSTAAALGATAVTTNGFTMGGPSGEYGHWVASVPGDPVQY